MAATSTKPGVIILGGLNTCSRGLASLLAPVGGEALVSHLRIVDKFSVHPATTYLGAEFPQILSSPLVEYRQANLTVPNVVSSVFDPPDSQPPYDYVFDLTGEVRHDRPEEVQINHTFHVSRLIGLEAAKRKVKAYVRLQQPWYESSEKGSHDEKQDAKPIGAIGKWWHETLRMLAAIPDLNLVILRIGLVWGPYVEFGAFPTMITVASVYGYLEQPMTWPHGNGKHPVDNTHIYDVAGGLWALAEWMAATGREQANIIAGEELMFHNDKSKVKEVEGMCGHNQKVIAPLFNLTNDTPSSMANIGGIVTSFFGTTFECSSSLLVSVIAKFKMDDLVEEINEAHVGAWFKMLSTSNPPITNTPLTAYVDSYVMSKHMIAFNSDKIKSIVGYQLKRPYLNHETLKETIGKWKVEGSWPILDA